MYFATHAGACCACRRRASTHGHAEEVTRALPWVGAYGGRHAWRQGSGRERRGEGEAV
jgi:hypothetical protein